jgi:hypothetical protein
MDSTWVDKLSALQKEQIDQALVELFYRCNLPFNVIDSKAFEKFIQIIRFAYKEVMPKAKGLGGAYLDKCYNNYKALSKKVLEDAAFYSIVTDGWSNIRSEHLVNFIIIEPNIRPFFLNQLIQVI